MKLLAEHINPPVKALMEELLTRNANSEPEKHQRPYLVTDWDNTAIIFDSQQSLFVYQAERLLYRLTPERFAEIIRKDLSPAQQEEVVSLLAKLTEDYQWIYHHYQGFTGHLSLTEIRETKAYQDFLQEIGCLYKYPFGHLTECRRILYLFENFRRTEVKEMTEKSIENAGEFAPTRKDFYFSDGKREYRSAIYLGMRFLPELMEWYQKCMQNGIEVYVVSASYDAVVEVHAAKYGIPPENVYALSVKEKDGKLIAEMDETRPYTVKKGKADTIRQFLIPYHHSLPILIMGDSMGDFEMMTEFSAPCILVCNKQAEEVMEALAQKGIRTGEKLFVQGRDEKTGSWLRSDALQSI